MMGDYFRETLGLFDSDRIDVQLKTPADLYDVSGACLKWIADKEQGREAKLSLLKETAEREKELESGLDALIYLAS